ncbi:hypothetical protein KU306_16575 (plasmid) [Haloferax larsenii]|uniref:Uncharacterized protein n=1 Tax=Haloferax larsenii TaxID=302484 RepID=A0ABY5RHU5_HALLR|nr:hypothetical protein [Haloferax larsenii]UVE51942.1 hypothetical protein KU306_16575 [Haloferax larsenii]
MSPVADIYKRYKASVSGLDPEAVHSPFPMVHMNDLPFEETPDVNT